MLMICVVIGCLDARLGDQMNPVGRPVLRVVRVRPMMRRPVCQSGARSGECDNRDETERDQTGERSSEHENKIVEAGTRSESGPLECRRGISTLTPCA